MAATLPATRQAGAETRRRVTGSDGDGHWVQVGLGISDGTSLTVMGCSDWTWLPACQAIELTTTILGTGRERRIPTSRGLPSTTSRPRRAFPDLVSPESNNAAVSCSSRRANTGRARRKPHAATHDAPLSVPACAAQDERHV